jgi:hypothetical protein
MGKMDFAINESWWKEESRGLEFKKLIGYGFFKHGFRPDDENIISDR